MTHYEIDSRSFVTRGLIVLLFVELLFVLLDGVINYGKLTELGQFRRMFNIAREDSIPSWFSVIQLFVLSGVVALCALFAKANDCSRTVFCSWSLISLFFFYMSADDAAEIHERIGSAFKAYVKSSGESGVKTFGLELLEAFPSYAWQVTIGPLFILFGIFIFLFLMKQLKHNKPKILLISGLSCFAIAIAFDFIEGIEGGHDFIKDTWKCSDYTVRHFAKSIEELIEMFGTSCILMAFVSFLGKQNADFRVTFNNPISKS